MEFCIIDVRAYFKDRKPNIAGTKINCTYILIAYTFFSILGKSGYFREVEFEFASEVRARSYSHIAYSVR